MQAFSTTPYRLRATASQQVFSTTHAIESISHSFTGDKYLYGKKLVNKLVYGIIYKDLLKYI